MTLDDFGWFRGFKLARQAAFHGKGLFRMTMSNQLNSSKGTHAQ